jgi:hypothetical protein
MPTAGFEKPPTILRNARCVCLPPRSDQPDVQWAAPSVIALARAVSVKGMQFFLESRDQKCNGDVENV